MTASLTASETVTSSPAAAAVVLLHGHLDAVLRHAEDLLAHKVTCAGSVANGTSVRALLRQAADVDRFVLDLLTSEQCMVLRCIRARDCAAMAAKQDRRFAPLAERVAAEIAGLLEAARQAPPGDRVDAHAVLASRGLGSPYVDAHVAPTESYRIFGRVPLGQWMDTVAGLLDALEQAAPPHVMAMLQPVPPTED